MAMLFDLEIGSAYNIPMLAPAVLGTSYKGATVKGLLDYSSAVQITDVAAIHASVLPLLPAGTPSDPTELIYVKILTSTGQITAIALNWISQQPTLITSTTQIVTVTNINQSQVAALAAALVANGFPSFTIAAG